MTATQREGAADAAPPRNPAHLDAAPANGRELIQENSTGRVEMVTDGVFAIAFTILVLNLRPPSGPAQQLPHDLRATTPALLIYFLTFLVLGGMWFRHHTEYNVLTRVDRPLVWLNQLFLAFVALIPWSASLVGAHPRATLSVLVYNLNLIAATMLQQSAWLYATRRPTPSMPVKLIAWSRVIGFLPTADYLIAAALVPFNPLAALAVDLLVPLVYVSGLLYRILFRLSH